MRAWSAKQVALVAGAALVSGDPDRPGPTRCSIDSRDVDPDTLFIGLAGSRRHGGEFVDDVLAAGAWGVLTDQEHAQTAARTSSPTLLSASDPLLALQNLAREWRRELTRRNGARVIGVTGSTGKTSTKDLLLAVLAPHRKTFASRANFNTEIGLPLELLRAPADTELLVLEMAMRGPGQIAELAQIAEPDVGVIVSIGPVHLELLGSLEAIAAAKAELVASLAPGATAIVPAHEPLLEPHLRDDLTTVTFGPGGDVVLAEETPDRVRIEAPGGEISLAVDFPQAHLRRNLLAAVAGALAVGVTPAGQVRLALSPGRGQRVELPDGVTLLDDSYNANPMSMRAALDELRAVARGPGSEPRRAVAVLGDMLELGPRALVFHREVGAHAADCADLLITVGELAPGIGEGYGREHHPAPDATAAAALLAELLEPGDVVLVKASNGVGLRRVCEALTQPAGARTSA